MNEELKTPEALSPETLTHIQTLWLKMVSEPRGPAPELLLVGRLTGHDHLTKITGGSRAHCEAASLDPGYVDDYERVGIVSFNWSKLLKV